MMEKYVAAKLMWDPDKDVNALKNEWISLYYGPAGNEINELVRRYEEMWFPLSEENPSFHLSYSEMSETLANQASQLLLGLQGLCDEGIAKINSSSLSETEKNTFIRRVEGVKLTFMFLELDQYEIYHHTSLSGRYELAVKVFDQRKRGFAFAEARDADLFSVPQVNLADCLDQLSGVRFHGKLKFVVFFLLGILKNHFDSSCYIS